MHLAELLILATYQRAFWYFILLVLSRSDFKHVINASQTSDKLLITVLFKYELSNQAIAEVKHNKPTMIIGL